MVTAAPDRLEHLLETLATAHHAALGFQDRMGDAVDVAADLFQDIGGAIDHGVEQVHQHRLAGNVRRTQTRELGAYDREGLRLVVAHGDEAMPRKDESDRRGARYVGVGMAHQRRRHEPRAILHIEPAGDLDLLHFLARRQRDAERALDQLVLCGGRRIKIEPHGAVRELAAASVEIDAFQGSAAGHADGEHLQAFLLANSIA